VALLPVLPKPSRHVQTTAVIVYFSAGYVDGVTTELLHFHLESWIWWIILYVAFILLNSAGSHVSFRFAIIVSIISLSDSAFVRRHGASFRQG
jgi:ethanolamine permease